MCNHYAVGRLIVGGKPNIHTLKKGNQTTIIFTFVAINCVFVSQTLWPSNRIWHRHSTAVAAAAAAAKTSTAHESIQDTLHTWIDVMRFAYKFYTLRVLYVLAKFQRKKIFLVRTLTSNIGEFIQIRSVWALLCQKYFFPQSHEIAF